MVDVLGRAADDVGHHAHALIEVDQRHHVGLAIGERGCRWRPDSARSSWRTPWPARWPARHSSADPVAPQWGQKERGVEDALVAGGAPLHQQRAFPGGLPERCAVGADRRLHAGPLRIGVGRPRPDPPAGPPAGPQPARPRRSPSSAIRASPRSPARRWTCTTAPCPSRGRPRSRRPRPGGPRPRPAAGAPPRR